MGAICERISEKEDMGSVGMRRMPKHKLPVLPLRIAKSKNSIILKGSNSLFFCNPEKQIFVAKIAMVHHDYKRLATAAGHFSGLQDYNFFAAYSCIVMYQ